MLGRYKRLRLSQADLVERTGISVTTMRRLIAGEAEFDVGQLWLLANALNVSPADILWEAEMGLSGARLHRRQDTPTTERKRASGLLFGRVPQLPHAAIADSELDSPDNVP